ncbi:DUF6177 family protein [Actinomadura verrucosospora]|uniref:Uncharacterized protein n=1 Tax=Actinomadura verrucosospora TaxID=46165 RepID=A0A7D3VTH6_ACTVE|nr:DUF6177 family protein [Actinomadura verrucosospora]QKG22439.1 hypothetical protein ACTIVE_4079 [Actinomadura verrucosospora]
MTQTAGGADVLTAHAMVMLNDRPVVPLSPAIYEALAECEGTNRTLQVVTSAASRVTLPLRTSKAQWLVHADNGYYEGLTGRPMHWNGTAFVPLPEARDYASTYTTPPTAPIGSQLVLTFQARHAPSAVLGAHTEKLMRLLTGEPPAGWGLTEPLQHPWHTDDLTTHITNTSSTRLIVVGAGTRPAIATSHFSSLAPPASGTAEITTLSIGYTYDEDPPIPQLPSFIDLLSADHPLTALLAQLVPGRPDLTTEPRWTGSSAPIGLASAGAYTGPPGFSRKRLGPPDAPVTWYQLGDGYSPEYWQRHQDLLTHLRRAT